MHIKASTAYPRPLACNMIWWLLTSQFGSARGSQARACQRETCLALPSLLCQQAVPAVAFQS